MISQLIMNIIMIASHYLVLLPKKIRFWCNEEGCSEIMG
jgi:hypothetical protein